MNRVLLLKQSIPKVLSILEHETAHAGKEDNEDADDQENDHDENKR